MQEEGQKRISYRPHPKTRQKRWKVFPTRQVPTSRGVLDARTTPERSPRFGDFVLARPKKVMT
jgi:hypothetical protein